jgi:Transposase, Mutator family
MYARGLSVREIRGHLLDLYGIEVSPDLISAVTDAVLDEVTQWQERPLEPLYPLVFFDALRVKVRDEGTVRNKAVHVALGVRPHGTKEILGLWIEQTEGAKFWLRVMTELKNRGVDDVLIAVVDGLKGFPDAITAVFPQAQVQTCIVHTIRTQSTIGRRERVAAGWRIAQRDDMADLQAVFVDDDALDDELQDRLPLLEGSLVETTADSGAERLQVRQHLLGLGSPPAKRTPLFQLTFQVAALLGQPRPAVDQLTQLDDLGLVGIKQPLLGSGNPLQATAQAALGEFLPGGVPIRVARQTTKLGNQPFGVTE